MQAIKTLETRNHTYYYGYITKYERTEAEKAERRYMITQKLLGFTFAALMILPAVLLKEPRLLLLTGIFAFIGIAVGLTDQHVLG